MGRGLAVYLLRLLLYESTLGGSTVRHVRPRETSWCAGKRYGRFD